MIQRFVFLNIYFGFFFSGAGLALAQEPVHYSIGDPTDNEQLNLEFINWARADTANAALVYAGALAGPNSQDIDPDIQGAYNHFTVDTGELITQFGTQPQSSQPLSFNPMLIEAARLHSQDQFNNIFQGHVSSSNPVSPNQPGDQLRDRANHQNYSMQGSLGENVFANAKSVWEGHVGFDVDWGVAAFGMQAPPGHRNAIHNVLYREIGIGIVLGTNSNGSATVGPLIVTQDFAYIAGGNPFITGVVYFDLNNNNFYDLGEGLPGVRVEIAGIDDFFAISSTSGGYSVPVPGNGNYEVTFSASKLSNHVVMSSVSGDLNEKLDYIPVYTPPTVTPPATVFVGFDNILDFNSVGGATAYNLRQSDLVPGSWEEGAENEEQQLSIVSTAGYDVIQSTSSYSGSFSFQLAQVNFEDQMVTLERIIRPTANSDLQFWSRLNGATSDQHARVQASTDNGNTWQDVYSQFGAAGDTFENNFSLRTVDLSGYADQHIKIRFFYDFNGGNAYPQTGLGWFFDDITVTNSSQVENIVETSLGDVTDFIFNPSGEESFLFEIQALSGGRTFPFGPAVLVQAETGIPPILPELTILSTTATSPTQFEIEFKAEGGTNFKLLLHHADGPGDAFTDTGMPVTQLGNNKYKFTVTFPGPTAKFYRVVVRQASDS